MGLQDVGVYGGSGNVIFAAEHASVEPTAICIQHGLEPLLGSKVDAFLRTASEVRAIAERESFNAKEIATSEGKIQVAILAARPSEHMRADVLAMATTDDRLAFGDRELYWLPRSSPADSTLDRNAIGRLVGPMTFQTKRTVKQIALKFLSN